MLYWHDPMVPNAKFDKPGKSPFMDMQLVPVYADAGDEGGTAVSARQVQNFGVRTAVATEGRLDAGFTATGAIGIDERAQVAVQSRSQGYVEKLYVRAQYDGVAAGQPLAELYVPDWLAAQEEWLALKASPQPGAAQLADAAKQRLRLLGMPDAEIARVEREGKPSARVTVTAPQGGHRLGNRRARRDGGDAGRDAVQARRHRHGLGDRRGAGSAGSARAHRRAGRGARRRLSRIAC